MLPGKIGCDIDEMKDTEEKKLLEILKENGEPFARKCDGYAVKMDEDKQIEYKDHEDNERTLTVPKDSYIIVDADCQYPKIVTSDDWESKNEFIKSETPRKEMKKPKLGIELMSEE